MQYGVHGPEHSQLIEEGDHLHLHGNAKQHLDDSVVDVVKIGAIVPEHQAVGLDHLAVAEPERKCSTLVKAYCAPHSRINRLTPEYFLLN